MSGFNLQGILRLGELDRKLIVARRRLDGAPRLADPQRQRVRDANDELERLTKETKQGNLTVKELEGEAQAKQGEIDKNQVALNQAKTNEEYQTLLRTIDGKTQELSDFETQILEAYEAQDDRAKRSKEIKDRLVQLDKELASAEGRVKDEEERVRGRIQELEGERQEIATTIDAEHLALYDRILVRRSDSAVAEVTDEICQGCGMKVRPEQISHVRGGKELVTCWTCERILHGKFGG